MALEIPRLIIPPILLHHYILDNHKDTISRGAGGYKATRPSDQGIGRRVPDII